MTSEEVHIIEAGSSACLLHEDNSNDNGKMQRLYLLPYPFGLRPISNKKQIVD